MTRRSLLAAGVAALLAVALPASAMAAAADVAPSAPQVAAKKPALKGFMQRLFGGRPQAGAGAEDGTMPADDAAANAEADGEGSYQLPPVHVAAGDIPLPHLRPTDATPVVVTLPRLRTAKEFTAGVTYETTGAIAEEDPAVADRGTPQPGLPVQTQPGPPPLPAPKAAATAGAVPVPARIEPQPAPAPPPPPAAPETAKKAVASAASAPDGDGGTVRAVGPTPPPFVAAPPPFVATSPRHGGAPTENEEARMGDDLLGDPTPFFPARPDDMQPVVPEPSAIDPSKSTPAAPPRNTGPRMAASMPPYEMVRTLQSLQDEVAQGSTKAFAAQRLLRTEIERRFLAAPASDWQDGRNAESAVIFVLSGGNPMVLEHLAKLDPPPAVDRRLLEGVLAYARGDAAVATTDLADLRPLDLPASMAAEIALTQSALAVRTDPKRAMELLSTARLLAPGTLVEEAAIRRQIFVADQLRDAAAVDSLARQYLDRFRHSVYAGNFRLRFAAALSHMDSIDSEAGFPRLDDMLASVEPEARCELYLTVALASSLKSQFTAARLASERAMALTAPASAEAARARLYHAAALVPDAGSYDTANADLAAVDRGRLTAPDQSLYDVVAVTLAGVASGTDRAAMPKAEALPPGDPNAKPDPLFVRAEDAIKSVDDLLQVAAR